jgi:arylsulfatase A
MKYLLIRLLLIITVSLGLSCSRSDNPVVKPVSSGNTSSLLLSHPNVILIVGDDIGYEIPTCDGGQSYSTPVLDRLAANGMRFTQCYSSPLCSPSRIALLTGKYNFRNYYAWGVLNKNQLTLGNLFRDNSYQTYYAGKWQLAGGDASIKKFGFQHYVVWKPFNVAQSKSGSRYKGPKLYANGKYISSSLLKNKYGEDIFVDSIESFISKNRQSPFFVYYAVTLAHKPFSPTPDDPDFAGWPNGNISKSDKKYFPGMIKYMDKKIGELMDYLKKKNIDKNTIVIYIGDNGTATEITSQFNGRSVTGGKGHTYTYGTHVPLIVYWKGRIPAGIVNDNLVSLPDFLPTLANLTQTYIPSSFKPIDGISFANQLFGDYSSARSIIYNYYHYDTSFAPVTWVQDTKFKLYDSTKNTYHQPGFYNMQSDIKEKNPLPYSSLKSSQKTKEQMFAHALDSINKK